MNIKHWMATCAITLILPVVAEAAPVKSIKGDFDLPPHRFTLTAPPSQAYMSDAFLRDTVPQLRHEAEMILRDYKVEDPAIAQRLNNGLAAIAILQNRPADAQAILVKQRKAETKPQLKAIGFMLPDAVAAGLQTRDLDRCQATAARVTALLAPSDAAVTRDEALVRYGRVQTASVGYYASTAEGFIDPEAKAQDGSINILHGMLLAIWRVETQYLPPCRDELSAAMKAWLDVPANKPTDIWAAREPTASQFEGAKPVVAAVWESGFDLSIFPGQIAIDPAEPLDGKDNDGNGVIDDAFGPTYDYNLFPTQSYLPKASPTLAARWGLQMAVSKGQLDLNYGEDTAEARFFAQRGREASVAEQAEDVKVEEEFGSRSHATWVAAAIADGAPHVRLYSANLLPFGNDPLPTPITEDLVDRWVTNMPKVAQRMRGAGVRVVNMSWTVSSDEIAEKLISSGLEKDQAKAKARADAMYERVKGALFEAIQTSPGILFVAAAGNSNQTDDILASAPQIFDLPNLIVIGATGSNGRPTTFTTFGKKVRLYARGEAVSTRGPGGQTLKLSGTSLAAPLVVRAVTQMLAVNPQLTPAQTISGLLATGTSETGGLKLVHAVNAVAWAKAQAGQPHALAAGGPGAR